MATLKETVLAEIAKLRADAQVIEAEAAVKVQALRASASTYEEKLATLPAEFHALEGWVWSHMKALFGKQ